MNKKIGEYAKVLFALGIEKGVVERTRDVYEKCPELKEALSNPAVTKGEKYRVIAQLFPAEIHNFLKVLCDNGSGGLFEEICTFYEKICLEEQNILEAELTYAAEPSEEQMEVIKEKLIAIYNTNGVKIAMKQEASLVGGFLLRVGDQEYDYSIRGRLAKLYSKLAWR